MIKNALTTLKNYLKFNNMEDNEIMVLKQGWQVELAKLCKCSRITVNNAIHHNARGEKAEKVRQMFKLKYGKKSN